MKKRPKEETNRKIWDKREVKTKEGGGEGERGRCRERQRQRYKQNVDRSRP